MIRPEAFDGDRALLDAIADERWEATCAAFDTYSPEGVPPPPPAHCETFPPADLASEVA